MANTLIVYFSKSGRTKSIAQQIAQEVNAPLHEITTQKTYLHKKGDAIEVIVEDKTVASIPMINLDSTVCFGNIYVSPFLLGAAPEHNITISFLIILFLFFIHNQSQ